MSARTTSEGGMKLTLLILAATLAGCATAPPEPAAAVRQHARNVAAAQRLGYEVLTEDGQTRFCATRAPTASHIVPACMTEDAWEQRHPVVAGYPGNSSGTVESGRSVFEGTRGY